MAGAGEVASAAPVPWAVQDGSGRELLLRELTALDRLRLFKALGAALSQNTAYVGMAMLAISVVAIDGVPIPPPVTEPQIEAVVAKLGDIGIAAVAEALARDSDPEMDGMTAGN